MILQHTGILQRRGQAGFSLLEVLVAGLVFSLGLAGLSTLLLLSFSTAAEASRENRAASAAASLAEQIRLNPAARERYLHPPEFIALFCDGAAPCTPQQQADYDFRLWRLELGRAIPGARALVCHDATPEDGVEGNGHCDGTGSLVIKIFWPGSAYAAPRFMPESDHRFTLRVD